MRSIRAGFSHQFMRTLNTPPKTSDCLPAATCGDRRCGWWRCWRGRVTPAPWRCRPGGRARWWRRSSSRPHGWQSRCRGPVLRGLLHHGKFSRQSGERVRLFSIDADEVPQVFGACSPFRHEGFELRGRDVLPSGLAVLEALDVLGRGLCHARHVSLEIGGAGGLHFSVKSRVVG